MPPQKISDIPHEDWVSSISCNLRGYVCTLLRAPRILRRRINSHLLTASYDGHIRVFDYSKNVTASLNVHNAPVTCLSLIPSQIHDESSTCTIATSSQDLTAAISRLRLSSNETENLATLHLHTAPVSSVAVNSSGSHLLTSSWDGLIGLWDAIIPSADEAPGPEGHVRERKKRRKIEDDSKPRRKVPINVLKSHTSRVSKVVFSQQKGTDTAYSCGFDSTIRVWDTEMGVSTQTIVSILIL